MLALIYRRIVPSVIGVEAGALTKMVGDIIPGASEAIDETNRGMRGCRSCAEGCR